MFQSKFKGKYLVKKQKTIPNKKQGNILNQFTWNSLRKNLGVGEKEINYILLNKIPWISLGKI
jgi:hypothetical protein